MEKLTALGTGYAVATKCFTTSFALTRENETLLIDTGGGIQAKMSSPQVIFNAFWLVTVKELNSYE